MRTTVDIADPILREVKRLAEADGRSMGSVMSELLADAVAGRRTARAVAPFVWPVHSMNARVSLDDKDALYAVLDADRS